MNDPFFEEDDGEFDDLYGNSRPSATSRNHEPFSAASNSSNSQSFTPSFDASSSAISMSYACDRTRSSASNTTDVVVPAKQDKRLKKGAKARRKGSKELFNVQWESNVKAVKCGLCTSDFSLVKRRHHCRHCGRVMCSDCSSFLYFEFSRRKHRVCVPCYSQLVAEQDNYERQATTESTLNARSSDTSPPSSSLQPLADDTKATKQQKERKSKEQKGKTSQDADLPDKKTAAANSRQPATDFNKKLTPDGALFDTADEGWFTDVPDLDTRSREDYSDDSQLTRSSWRDRVKDTYTVTSATDQSTLTAGIPGKGYMSDQFRYDDVSGPGLGHDDDMRIEMPRPEQSIVAPVFPDYSIKSPHHPIANGYESEHHQYDVVGGSDDSHSDAMSWPKQPTPIAPLKAPNAVKREQLEADSTDDSTQDFQPWLTFTNIFKATKRRESTAQKDKETKTSKSRARGNENMTLDELNPSNSSLDEPLMLLPTVSSSTTATRSTFYDQDADKLVVDDSPGYFEVAMAARNTQSQKKARQNEGNIERRSTSALPPSTEPRRFSSGQESYSIVDVPSHTSNSPVQKGTMVEDGHDTGTRGKTSKKSFTGALKRFFGVGSTKATTTSTPSASDQIIALPKQEQAEKKALSRQLSTNDEDSVSRDAISGRLSRATIAASNGFPQEQVVLKNRHRYTIAEGHGREDVSLSVQGGEKKHQQGTPEPPRERRGTFDELFRSPKSNAHVSGFIDKYEAEGAREWVARGNENSIASRASVGVKAIEETKDAEAMTARSSSRSARYSTENWRESAALSLLHDTKASAPTESFTWSNVRSVPGLETATYAVPLSLQSRPFYDAKLEIPTSQASAPLDSIMDAYTSRSRSKHSQEKDSIDDFFATFEETNEYVFDSKSGGYVAARIPARASLASKRVEAFELEQRTSDREERFESLALATSDHDSEEVEDEVQEIIVDKISSLESELAALKQLIRNRKNTGKKHVSKPRNSLPRKNTNVRKESIFESESSDEEEHVKTREKWQNRPQTTDKTKTKQKLVPPRKSSFADLFEDSPTGGSTSYEALFQMVGNVCETSKEDDSDENGELTLHSREFTSKRHPPRSPFTSVITDDETTSLEETREIETSVWKPHQDVNDVPRVLKENHEVTVPLKLNVTPKVSKKQTEEEDPIDALFNTATDRDVIKLYQIEDGDEDDGSQFGLNGSPNDVEDTSVALAPAPESAASVIEGNLSYSFPVISQDSEENVEDEEDFVINWSKMRTFKSQRQTLRAGESSASDTTTNEAPVTLNLFDKEANVKVETASPKHTLPVSIPLEEPSSWMAAAAPDKENIELDVAGDENVESRCDNKHMDLAAAMVKNKSEDKVEVPSKAVSMIHTPVEEARMDLLLPHANESLVSDPTWKRITKDDDASFDIFDNSSDLPIQVSSLLDHKAPEDVEESDDNDDDEGNDEAFSFENRTFKKQSTEDISTSFLSGQAVPERVTNSSLPSPISTADENVELGKYTTVPVQRSPIDGSLDEKNKVTKEEDDPVLGKLEAEAFDADWQQLQAKEKERKRRLQVKQRQAQRDKLQRKQSSLTKSSLMKQEAGGNKTTSKSGKKKKKDRENDGTASISSHSKKKGSSRKIRRDATDNAAPLEPPRSLTEL